MKVLSMDRPLLRRRILRLNILTGLLVFIVAFGISIFGELKAADTQFSFIAIGGLLYAAFAWIFCVMSKPFWFPLATALETNDKD